jgi:hypothetical protein
MKFLIFFLILVSKVICEYPLFTLGIKGLYGFSRWITFEKDQITYTMNPEPLSYEYYQAFFHIHSTKQSVFLNVKAKDTNALVLSLECFIKMQNLSDDEKMKISPLVKKEISYDNITIRENSDGPTSVMKETSYAETQTSERSDGSPSATKELSFDNTQIAKDIPILADYLQNQTEIEQHLIFHLPVTTDFDPSLITVVIGNLSVKSTTIIFQQKIPDELIGITKSRYQTDGNGLIITITPSDKKKNLYELDINIQMYNYNKVVFLHESFISYLNSAQKTFKWFTCFILNPRSSTRKLRSS